MTSVSDGGADDATRRRGLGLRRLNRAVHRDLGYLTCVLTILYAVSGLAVNHVDDWNPSYATTVDAVSVGPLTGLPLDAMERRIQERAGLAADDVRGRHQPARERIIVFLPHGGEVRVDVATGEGTMRRVRPRPGLFESNVLHLNHLKGAWTYVADVYAAFLLLLAVTGLFILKGRTGLLGRGKWLVGAGTLLPVGFLVYYYLTRAS